MEGAHLLKKLIKNSPETQPTLPPQFVFLGPNNSRVPLSAFFHHLTLTVVTFMTLIECPFNDLSVSENNNRKLTKVEKQNYFNVSGYH